MNALTVLTSEIRQFDGLYSLNDLHKAAGNARKHQPYLFLRLDTTQALIAEIHSTDLCSATKTINGGPNRGTYVCKELVYAYAMWISPKFHLTVIRAFDAMSSAPEATYSMTMKRWLVSFDDQGREYAKSIPREAVVMTPKEFIRYLGEESNTLSDCDLLECINQASARLKRRSDSRAKLMRG